MSEHADEELLLDLLLEALPAAEAARARAHLEACGACGERLARLEQEQAALGQALRRVPPAPAGLEARIVRSLAGEPLSRGRAWPGLAAVAAAALVAGALGLFLFPQAETPRQVMLRQVRLSELKALGLEVGR